MTKQEEIRGAINKVLVAARCGDYNLGSVMGRREAIYAILKVEEELGVVIKVEKKLPSVPLFRWIGYGAEMTARLAYESSQKDMREAGYVAVQPLI